MAKLDAGAVFRILAKEPQVLAKSMHQAFDYMAQYAVDLETKVRELSEDLYTDPVTGGENRKSFLVHLENAIEEMRDNPDAEYTVVFIDLDGFKGVNDACGHEAGDEALMDADFRLMQSINQNGSHDDKVARMGGDEMVLLLKNTPGRDLSLERLRFVTRKVFKGMGQWLFESNQNESYYPVLASVGAFRVTQDFIKGKTTQDAVTEALKAADLSMYEDKADKHARLNADRLEACAARIFEADLVA